MAQSSAWPKELKNGLKLAEWFGFGFTTLN